MQINIDFDFFTDETLLIIEACTDELFLIPDLVFLHDSRNPNLKPTYLFRIAEIKDTAQRLTAQAAVAMIASLRYQTLTKDI